MTDKTGRKITYLRLSLTDRCNLRCIYCMPEHGVKKLKHEDIMTYEETVSVVQAAAACGITKLRLTGGEPLLRKGVVELTRKLSSVEGIKEVCMTTNGVLLSQYAKPLRDAGVSRLNISIDTLNPEKFSRITRIGTLEDALKGIKAAEDAGFDRIKINTVLMGGINDDEIRGLAEFSLKRGFQLRFIELMPVGECSKWDKSCFISCDAVLKAMPELMPGSSEGVARLYRMPGYRETIGIISPLSMHFCPSCNRIRVTADGKLKPCLHSADEIDLRGLSGAGMESTIKNAILSKPMRHHLDEKPSESRRNMNAIGG